MAVRKRLYHPDEVREKIQSSQIINRLNSFALGKLEMTKPQVTAALGLLKKTLPDLQSVEHSGNAENPLLVRCQFPIVPGA